MLNKVKVIDCTLVRTSWSLWLKNIIAYQYRGNVFSLSLKKKLMLSLFSLIDKLFRKFTQQSTSSSSLMNSKSQRMSQLRKGLPRNRTSSFSFQCFESGCKWNMGGDSFFFCPININKWRLTSYLDFANNVIFFKNFYRVIRGSITPICLYPINQTYFFAGSHRRRQLKSLKCE